MRLADGLGERLSRCSVGSPLMGAVNAGRYRSVLSRSVLDVVVDGVLDAGWERGHRGMRIHRPRRVDALLQSLRVQRQHQTVGRLSLGFPLLCGLTSGKREIQC